MHRCLGEGSPGATREGLRESSGDLIAVAFFFCKVPPLEEGTTHGPGCSWPLLGGRFRQNSGAGKQESVGWSAAKESSWGKRSLPVNGVLWRRWKGFIVWPAPI